MDTANSTDNSVKTVNLNSNIYTSASKWHVEYDKDDGTTTKLTFNNKIKADNYAKIKSTEPDINNIWSYESPPPSPTANLKLNPFVFTHEKMIERKKKLVELVEEWNKVYSN
jgi:hypothetical protein